MPDNDNKSILSERNSAASETYLFGEVPLSDSDNNSINSADAVNKQNNLNNGKNHGNKGANGNGYNQNHNRTNKNGKNDLEVAVIDIDQDHFVNGKTMTTYEDIVQRAHTAFNSGKTRNLDFREKNLRALLRMYEENEEEMCKALATDLRKSKQESMLNEVFFLQNDLNHILSNFRDWAKPEKPEKPLVNFFDGIRIHKDPFGVALVIGAWNYPLQLTMIPVQNAIAAGNCVIIKPSEIATASAQFLADYIPKYLDSECYHVVVGGVKETTELLKQKFDYIFYTGSARVGQIIHAAANKYLTPVTLELGGKSPCYLDNTIDIDLATKRILWGKFINNGQTCIAPDYVLCTKEVQGKFLESAKKCLKEWYGDEHKDSPDLCRMINSQNYQRVSSMLKGANIALGGKLDPDDKFIGPTILIDVKANDAVMREEIFGPILPIINIENAFEAIQFINDRDLALTMYVFTKEEKVQELFLNSTRSGSVSINDTVMLFTIDVLPFGGVGMSGMGAYHGKYSFDTFTHHKSVLDKGTSFIPEFLSAARYPPYTEGKLSYLTMLLKKRPGIAYKYFTYAFLIGIGAASVILYNSFTKKR